MAAKRGTYYPAPNVIYATSESAANTIFQETMTYGRFDAGKPAYTLHADPKGIASEYSKIAAYVARTSVNSPRGLFDFLGGLVSSPRQPTTTNTSVSFTTTVSDEQSFRLSLKSLNESINNMIVSASQMSSTELAQTASFNFVNVTATKDINLNLNSQQKLVYLNINKLDAKVANNFVLNQATTIFEQILSEFRNTNVSAITAAASSSRNSNLIDSILSSGQSDNVNTAINSNASVRTAYNAERDAVYQSLSKNEVIANFSQKLVASLSQTFNVNVQGLSSNGTINILVASDQQIQATLDIVTKLDVASAAFNTISTSDTFKIDRTVTNVAQTVAQATATQANKSETLSDLTTAGGQAAKNVLSGVSSVFSSIYMPILVGGAAVGIYLVTRSSSAQLSESREPLPEPNGQALAPAVEDEPAAEDESANFSNTS